MAEPAGVEADILTESPLWRGFEAGLKRALACAARMEGAAGEVSLLLADDAAVRALNRDFRGKDRPTNVLSFPPGEGARGFLGDIALAAETVLTEAKNQGKTPEHHAAHLAVHGFLHLLGYDHEIESEAEAMEARERAILAELGIADPYGPANQEPSRSP